MAYTELTVWTRGIIMDKEGRDIVGSIGAAARMEGKFSQSMENYVDNPDRTNAPTRKYCRMSDGVIENALTYENEHPNIVVLVEETMVKGWDYMRGMPPGGTLVINTHYSPEYMIRFVPDPERLTVPFAGITPAPSQEKGQDLFPTGNWRAIRPVYRDKLPPCNNACGTNEKIQGYLDLVKRGKYLDAYALIKEDMPFPSVTGRVCYHPCEQACNRGKHDEAISIRAVERFLGDLGQALPRDVVTPGPPNGKKVAVVGSGPAGHSAAYQLARLGYTVTIFEKSPKAGGLNRGGIPH